MVCGQGNAEEPEQVSGSRPKLIGCATLVEEIQPIVPAWVDVEVFDFGLHLRPHDLRDALQAAIDAAADDHDQILLGYGLCSLAVVGLQARDCTLAMPRVDDCIGALLGGQDTYRALNRQEPGTYYLTKGWIEVGDTLLDTHQQVLEQYGAERAERIMATMLKHYRRLVYIDTGQGEQDRHRADARRVADRFGLAYEEVSGSPGLMAKLLHGPWDDDILVVEPGKTVTYTDFRTSAPLAANLGPAAPADTPTGTPTGTPVELGHG